MRSNYEDSHSIYLKAGEPIDVLLDGQAGTGFTWVSNLDWLQQNGEDVASPIRFKKSKQIEDDSDAFADPDYEGFRSMGRKQSYRHSFKTEVGQDFNEVISFVYARPWMLKKFPQNRAEAGADFSTISVIAKESFAHDFVSENFSLEALPNELTVKAGDLIRLVLRENPTTGYWWHTNARWTLDAPIRELYNGFEAPDLNLIGASGQRVLVFEINDPTTQLKLGLTRPQDEEDINGQWDGADDDLDSHLFTKQIQFTPGQAQQFLQ